MAKSKAQSVGDGRTSGDRTAKQAESGMVAIPLVRDFPPGQVGVLANHFVIQHDGPEFHLLFFQTHPPIVLAQTDEERRKLLEATESVRSVCIARIIVSAERMPAVIRAMQDNLQKYQESQATTDATKE